MKSCGFLIDSFEKVLYLAELQAGSTMALSYCKALYSSSKMAWLMYFVGFLYLVISSFILIEKWSLPCSQTSRLLKDRLCANQSGVSQFYSIWTDTGLRQSPFYHLSHSSSCLEICWLPLLA